jgi:MerR family transcriptional regulator, light-induced transcriptional regulator
MPNLNERVIDVIEAKRSSLSEAIVDRQYKLQPEIWEPYGEKGRNLSIRDADHHFTYLVQALSEADPSLFAQYVDWLRGLFAGLKFPPEVLPVMLECTRDVLRESLSPDMAAITDQYLDVALTLVAQTYAPQPSFLSKDAPLHELATRYLESLLSGDRHTANRLILDAVERGTGVKDIYINVFQRSQYEVGRLWYTNQVSVAQEHFCSAGTQMIMSQLYPHIFSTEKIGRRLVAACVGGELHEIGVRMVADFFEMEGWDTYYLGANSPASSIIEAIETRGADVLGLSAAMPFHRKPLREIIEKVREFSGATKVKILVGGYAVKSSPGLWQRIGADGFAEDAQNAVITANRLMVEKALQ